MPLRADRYTRDEGDLLAAVTMALDRGLPTWRPSLADWWDQEKSGLVDEDEVGPQPCGVFFIRGHSSRFHRSISSSLRSTARRSGFWWLHRICPSKRPTWSRWCRIPKFFSITSAIRWVVHSSVRYPLAIAPFNKISANRSFWATLSFGGRPGEARTSKAASPFSFRASRHRITELAWQPTCLATLFMDAPSSNRANARRRRSTIRSPEPFGRNMNILLGYPLLHYLCRSQ